MSQTISKCIKYIKMYQIISKYLKMCFKKWGRASLYSLRRINSVQKIIITWFPITSGLSLTMAGHPLHPPPPPPASLTVFYSSLCYIISPGEVGAGRAGLEQLAPPWIHSPVEAIFPRPPPPPTTHIVQSEV